MIHRLMTVTCHKDPAALSHCSTYCCQKCSSASIHTEEAAFRSVYLCSMFLCFFYDSFCIVKIIKSREMLLPKIPDFFCAPAYERDSNPTCRNSPVFCIIFPYFSFSILIPESVLCFPDQTLNLYPTPQIVSIY